MALEYWLRGDAPPGPIKATVLTDVRRVAETLARFKGSAVLLLGSQLPIIEEIAGGSVTEKLINIIEAVDGETIVSSSEVVRRLDALGYRRYRILFPLEAIQSISRNSGRYRIALLAGFKYSYAWLLLNHLKHYNPELNTLSLDPYPQPNATWTLPSLPLQVWLKNLMQIVDTLKAL